eukprot:6195652-Pleurochrysis_carterae.AAC.3
MLVLATTTAPDRRVVVVSPANSAVLSVRAAPLLQRILPRAPLRQSVLVGPLWGAGDGGVRVPPAADDGGAKGNNSWLRLAGQVKWQRRSSLGDGLECNLHCDYNITCNDYCLKLTGCLHDPVVCLGTRRRWNIINDYQNSHKPCNVKLNAQSV